MKLSCEFDLQPPSGLSKRSPMNFRIALPVIAALILAGCSNAGLYRWVPFYPNPNKSHAITVHKDDPFGPITGPVVYGLEVRVLVNPPVINLASTRNLDVRLQLINRTRKAVNLNFNDSRHYDFILTDAAGKKLVQWSDDQPVNQTPGYVIINPQERSEFAGNISTRDMVAGRIYNLRVIVYGYDRLQQTVQLHPGP
jgi:hypothetical protein